MFVTHQHCCMAKWALTLLRGVAHFCLHRLRRRSWLVQTLMLCMRVVQKRPLVSHWQKALR